MPLPRLLITAGPTQEPVDKVRYLSNRSSGRMGRALAEAGLARDLPATLLLGPVAEDQVPHYSTLTVERFRTAADLQSLLSRHWPDCDILVMAAAVADFRPAATGQVDKLRRGDGPVVLTLEPVPDLLASLASSARPDQVLIGFALEPVGNLLEAAREKLVRKGIDGIVANPLETLDSDRIAGTLVTNDGEVAPPGGGSLTKRDFADWLLDRALELWQKKNR